MEKRQRNLLIAFAVIMLVVLPLFSWALAAILGG
jgi:nitrate reductase NapE component